MDIGGEGSGLALAWQGGLRRSWVRRKNQKRDRSAEIPGEKPIQFCFWVVRLISVSDRQFSEEHGSFSISRYTL